VVKEGSLGVSSHPVVCGVCVWLLPSLVLGCSVRTRTSLWRDFVVEDVYVVAVG